MVSIIGISIELCHPEMPCAVVPTFPDINVGESTDFLNKKISSHSDRNGKT